MTEESSVFNSDYVKLTTWKIRKAFDMHTALCYHCKVHVNMGININHAFKIIKAQASQRANQHLSIAYRSRLLISTNVY